MSFSIYRIALRTFIVLTVMLAGPASSAARCRVQGDDTRSIAVSLPAVVRQNLPPAAALVADLTAIRFELHKSQGATVEITMAFGLSVSASHSQWVLIYDSDGGLIRQWGEDATFAAREGKVFVKPTDRSYQTSSRVVYVVVLNKPGAQPWRASDVKGNVITRKPADPYQHAAQVCADDGGGGDHDFNDSLFSLLWHKGK